MTQELLDGAHTPPGHRHTAAVVRPLIDDHFFKDEELRILLEVVLRIRHSGAENSFKEARALLSGATEELYGIGDRHPTNDLSHEVGLLGSEPGGAV